MLMKNKSDAAVRCPQELLVVTRSSDEYVMLEPGEEVEIKEGYCHPRLSPNRSRLKSVVEQLCPGLEPSDEKCCAAWRKAPGSDYVAPKAELTVAQYASMGLSPGAAVIAAAKAEKAAQAKRAAAEAARLEKAAAKKEEESKEDSKPRRRKAKEE